MPGKVRSNLVDFGQHWLPQGRIRANPQNVVKLAQIRAEFGRSHAEIPSTLVELGPESVELGRTLVEAAGLCRIRAEPRFQRPLFDTCWTTARQLLSNSGAGFAGGKLFGRVASNFLASVSHPPTSQRDAHEVCLSDLLSRVLLCAHNQVNIMTALAGPRFVADGGEAPDGSRRLVLEGSSGTLYDRVAPRGLCLSGGRRAGSETLMAPSTAPAMVRARRRG